MTRRHKYRPVRHHPRNRPPPGPPSVRERLLRLLVFTLSALIWFLLIAGVVQWWLEQAGS
ncbi:hypothetical protein SAMN02745824_3088 [Parasphingorhabdus marina DSM 22363]|uniref:Uncharacterized protein n=1 Tax=Parasphingorhabdus marina DSM 22363 TaxID=1123272 RepID=A0A1N6H142_9SPHN|nr:hypothetical protein [Parasphingorhabdus marina]SIO13538.1 hypothetical protein SAMN02745824_3088 [Parasphingorhabdus marina DSM 22363]